MGAKYSASGNSYHSVLHEYLCHADRKHACLRVLLTRDELNLTRYLIALEQLIGKFLKVIFYITSKRRRRFPEPANKKDFLEDMSIETINKNIGILTFTTPFSWDFILS